MNAPYSQCDAKGRCIRHPTIQMQRKKKLGGWKTLLSLCPMCAMELMNSEDCGAAYCGDIASPMKQSGGGERGVEPPAVSGGSPSSHRGPSSHHGNSSSRHGGSRRSNSRAHHSSHADDRSTHTAQSIRSAPSTYNRRDSQGSAGSSSGGPTRMAKGSSSDSSCDSTVDMSYSSHSSASYATPRGTSYRRSGSIDSRASAHSSGSRHSHHSARSANSQRQRHRRRQAPQVGHHDTTPQNGGLNRNTLPPNQEQFVCGMEYGEPGMYYTGQIDVSSRLPHGLGTLRSEGDKTIFEGEWSFGRLVRESGNNTHHSQVHAQGQEYQQERQGEDYCQPCNNTSYEDSLNNSFNRQCHVALEDCEEGSESSFSNNSIAETIHDDESQSSWSRGSSRSGSQNSSYSARESKAALPPSSTNSRATQHKLQEYERYIERCDTEEDYYSYEGGDDNDSSSRGRSSSQFGSGRNGSDHYNDGRPRKVRFREDP